MKKFLPLCIVLLGFVLRVWHYESFPVGGETADEGAWTLLGASLIQERVPASWSYFAAYESFHYREGVYDAPVVRPAFDHPPLFALLPGAFHSLRSQWLDLPSFKVIRAPMVLLGTLNVWLFWLAARALFAKKNWALVAMVLFATIPSIVFGSRLAVAENLLITWIIATLYLVTSGLNTATRRWLVVISAAAVLTKMSGLVVPASLIVLGGISHRREVAKIGFIGALIGGGLFALYGAAYNWPLFTAVFSAQADRSIGLATLTNRLFLHPTLVKHAFFDGWKLIGLFATFALLPSLPKKWSLVSVLTLMSLFFIALTTGETTLHGWYDFMLWPTLVVSATVLLQMLYENRNGIGVALTWVFVLPAVRLAAVANGWLTNVSSLVTRVIIAAGVLPLVGQWLNSKKLFKISYWLLLAILLVSNIIPVFSLTHAVYWEQAAFFETW